VGLQPPRALAGVAVGLIVICSTLLLPVRPAGASTSSTAPGFHTVGNQIIGPTGTPFVPMGFVLMCLASPDLSCMQASSQSPVTDTEKITAAAQFWHANIVRLQVSQEHLFSQSPYDASYLAAIENEIHEANSLGMVVSVTLQEELYGGPLMPTASSVRFWKLMAQQLGNRTGVFFDLFNEPRLKPLQGEDWLWNIWRNGGQATSKGKSYTFVGMQTLVDTIRQTGADNIIVAEGNGADHEISELTSHLLKGSNIAYAIEPNITMTRSSPQQWDALYGNTAEQVPLVMDAFQDYPTGHCYAGSPSVLPQLFSYLQAKHLGLIVWTLQSGNLYVGNNVEEPTTYQGSDYQLCVPHGKGTVPVQGVDYDALTNQNGPGQDILNFFRSTSQTLPPSVLLGTSGGVPSGTPTGVVQGGSGSGSNRYLIWLTVVVVGLALAIVFLARRSRRRRHT
jgi:hypothetical protein